MTAETSPAAEGHAYRFSPTLDRRLNGYRRQIDQALIDHLGDPNPYTHRVFQAMRYSLVAGGKRLRPILCLLACRLAGGRAARALPVACAVEYIHTYSLIHDDLPALDNDDFRRGKPSCHKKFGEATAILAGDSLLTEAFSVLSRRDLLRGVDPIRRLKLIEEISRAAGLAGMIGGQEADLFGERKRVSLNFVTYLHTQKTGALITAALVGGGLVGGGEKKLLQDLRQFGRQIGLAFQIQDDLLNVIGKSRLTGKGTGTDARRSKATYPAKIGVERSRQRARELIEAACRQLAPWGPKTEPLAAVSHYIISRDH